MSDTPSTVAHTSRSARPITALTARLLGTCAALFLGACTTMTGDPAAKNAAPPVAPAPAPSPLAPEGLVNIATGETHPVVW